MTRRQASDLARARILDAVRTGASLEAACVAAGVSRSNLANWRRQDPAFAAAFDAVTAELAATSGVRRGARHRFTEADWDAFLAQLAEGRLTVEQISRLPGMPSAAAFAKRRKADPAFEARLAEVWKPIRERERDAVDWEGALARVAAGDVLEGFAGTGGYPLAATWFARRKREPAFDVRAAEAQRLGQEKRAGGRTSPAMLERILAELGAGKSLHAVCAQPGMPTRTAVKAFGRRSTAFALRLQAAWTPASPFRYCDADYSPRPLRAPRRPIGRRAPPAGPPRPRRHTPASKTRPVVPRPAIERAGGSRQHRRAPLRSANPALPERPLVGRQRGRLQRPAVVRA